MSAGIKAAVAGLWLATLSPAPSLAQSFPWPPEFVRDVILSENDRLNLQAQQDMVKWTAAMTCLTGITVIFGFVSIAFLFTSFRQTTKALEEARETNRQAKSTAFIENRPWLIPDVPILKEANPSLGLGFIDIEVIGSVRIRNIGRLPAHRLSVTFSLRVADSDQINIDHSERGVTVPPGGSVDVRLQQTIRLHDYQNGEVDTRLTLFGLSISYRDFDHEDPLMTESEGVLAVSAPNDRFAPLVATQIRTGPYDPPSFHAFNIGRML